VVKIFTFLPENNGALSLWFVTVATSLSIGKPGEDKDLCPQSNPNIPLPGFPVQFNIDAPFSTFPRFIDTIPRSPKEAVELELSVLNFSFKSKQLDFSVTVDFIENFTKKVTYSLQRKSFPSSN